MKKIGIMSMQRVINYGSFLQAYALKKCVEKLGNNVEFVDYKFERCIIKTKPKKSFFEKAKNNVNIIKFINKKRISRKFRTKYELEYLKFLNINKNEYNYVQDIDTLIIGSDEVFNCLQPYPVGYSRNLFGFEYENKNVISYAASFGHTTLNALKEVEIDNEIGKMLSKFRAISIRDANSYNIVKKISGIMPIISFDPVLIGDFNEEIGKNKISKCFDHYVIVYAYTGRLTKNEQKYIKKFAKRNNLKIISLGFYQEIADKNIVVNPFQVLNYFKNADYVITDTFHGTIFSVKMNTKFCTIIRDSNYNKLSFLLKELKHENRMVNKIEDIEKLYKKEINFKESNEIIKIETTKTMEYLKNNI